MPGPLYHNGPAVWACSGLLAGNHVVLLERFDAEGTLAAIEQHRADVVYLVPTMMKRILRLPDDVRLGYDLSSLRIVWHLAEPCPIWLKEAWIDWLGPERILELYAGTEAQAVTIITGRGMARAPWLGRSPVGRRGQDHRPRRQRGAARRSRARCGCAAAATRRRTATSAPRRARWTGGWESLGDMGWFDEDGYLYLGDRMQDMILSGGANIYPAEIEAAHPGAPGRAIVCVIGLPDEDRGNVVHAIVEADPDALDVDELLAFTAERLARYKVPRSVEIVDDPLRDDAGKVRRAALPRRAARTELNQRWLRSCGSATSPTPTTRRRRRCSTRRSSTRRSISWPSSPVTVGPSSWRSGPGGSPCRCALAAFRCRGSSCRRTWPSGCAPSPAPTTSPSSSAT